MRFDRNRRSTFRTWPLFKFRWSEACLSRLTDPTKGPALQSGRSRRPQTRSFFTLISRGWMGPIGADNQHPVTYGRRPVPTDTWIRDTRLQLCYGDWHNVIAP